MTAFPPVRELLPHADPMVLVDEVVEAGAEHVRCRVRIGPDAPFFVDGAVPAVVAIEYMAQTIGAYAGLQARAAGMPVRIGYLLGTRELTLETDAFRAGDELLVEARQVWLDPPLAVFACRVERGGVPVAAASLNVYQSQGEEPPA